MKEYFCPSGFVSNSEMTLCAMHDKTGSGLFSVCSLFALWRLENCELRQATPFTRTKWHSEAFVHDISSQSDMTFCRGQNVDDENGIFFFFVTNDGDTNLMPKTNRCDEGEEHIRGYIPHESNMSIVHRLREYKRLLLLFISIHVHSAHIMYIHNSSGFLLLDKSISYLEERREKKNVIINSQRRTEVSNALMLCVRVLCIRY